VKCLEKDSRRRYSSAQALADDLHAWLEGRPIAARPVGMLERAGLFVRRRPALAASYALTAAVLVLAVFGVTVAWLWRAAAEARAGEVRARVIAENARDAEAMARSEADGLRDKIERVEYGRTIEVAYQEWREDNIPATVALLNGTRLDLRGWEWRYVYRLCHSDLERLKQPLVGRGFAADVRRSC
jgi:hypothetical protein